MTAVRAPGAPATGVLPYPAKIAPPLAGGRPVIGIVATVTRGLPGRTGWLDRATGTLDELAEAEQPSAGA